VVEEELDKVFLRTGRVEANLVANGFVFSVGQYVCGQLNIEVGQADAFCKSSVHKTLHALVENVHGDGRLSEEVVWPVDVVGVDVVEPHGLQ